MNTYKSSRAEISSIINSKYSKITLSNAIRPQSQSNSRIQKSFYHNNIYNSNNNNNKSNLNKNKSTSNKTKKSSANKVLSNILDSKKKFNIYSPSQLKQKTEEINIIKNQKNLESNHSISEDEEKNIYLIESISKCLLEINNSNSEFINMDINSKVLYLMHLINNENIKIRLGSIIIEYFLLKKNFDILMKL